MYKYLIIFIFGFFTLTSCSSSNSPNEAPKNQTTDSSTTKILYVDVREDNEWMEWHIDGAIHVKLGDIEAGKYDKIPKDIPVSLYCRSGRRSGIAHDILSKAGYTNITNVWGMTTVTNVIIVQ